MWGSVKAEGMVLRTGDSARDTKLADALANGEVRVAKI